MIINNNNNNNNNSNNLTTEIKRITVNYVTIAILKLITIFLTFNNNIDTNSSDNLAWAQNQTPNTESKPTRITTTNAR